MTILLSAFKFKILHNQAYFPLKILLDKIFYFEYKSVSGIPYYLVYILTISFDRYQLIGPSV